MCVRLGWLKFLCAKSGPGIVAADTYSVGVPGKREENKPISAFGELAHRRLRCRL